MCDFNQSADTVSNALRAHDLAMLCVGKYAAAKLNETPDLTCVADEYLKAYVFFWDRLNDFVREQSDNILAEHHDHEHHDHEHHHHEHHHTH